MRKHVERNIDGYHSGERASRCAGLWAAEYGYGLRDEIGLGIGEIANRLGESRPPAQGDTAADRRSYNERPDEEARRHTGPIPGSARDRLVRKSGGSLGTG